MKQLAALTLLITALSASAAQAADPWDPVPPALPLEMSCTTTAPVVRVEVTCTAVGDLFSEDTTYEWAWGDGARSTGKTASHTYVRSGYQEFRLVAGGSAGYGSVTASWDVQKALLVFENKPTNLRKALKSGIPLTLSSAGPNETVTYSIRFRGVHAAFDVTANSAGKSAIVFKPSKLMRKAMKKRGLMTVRAKTPTSKGARDINLR